jgi:heme A synthase
MAENIQELKWKSALITALFCIVAALGGGMTIKMSLANSGGWVVAGYAVTAGIFMAISAVILMQVLSALSKE